MRNSTMKLKEELELDIKIVLTDYYEIIKDDYISHYLKNKASTDIINLLNKINIRHDMIMDDCSIQCRAIGCPKNGGIIIVDIFFRIDKEKNKRTIKYTGLKIPPESITFKSQNNVTWT